jgi:ABC-type antimicrobial peptide transport system permease subunit
MTMKQRQEKELVLFRAAVISLGTLGTLGLLLAAVGLYAVVSYAVAQRTSELGIRIALGARPGDLTWLVVRDVTALVVVGIAIGSAPLVDGGDGARVLGLHRLWESTPSP